MKADEMLGLLQSMDDSELTRENILKAPFPYPGGKQNSIGIIAPHLPYTDYYCEPFGGSGCILLARQKVKNEYFNDRFSGVTDFYHCVKNRDLCQKLLEWLHFTPFSREEFIRCRDSWRDSQDHVERAARWYVQVMMSFQAYGRHYGRSKTANAQFAMKLPNALKNFWPVHYRLQGVYIENQDWRQMFRDFDSHKRVWYCDPPYLNVDKMYEHDMTFEDHVELCQRIHQLEGFVALSGYESALYNSFPWKHIFKWEVRLTASAAIGTETNNRKDSVSTKNEMRVECLYIKDFS